MNTIPRHPQEIFKTKETQQGYEADSLHRLDALVSRPIHLTDAFEVAGLLGDMKPGSFMGYDPDITKELTNLGFSCIIIDLQYDDDYTLVTSKNPETAQMLADQLQAEEVTDENIRATGKLLGYPETATEYFIQRSVSYDASPDVWLPMIVPKNLQGTVASEFHQFVLSPDHWRQEVESFIMPIEQAAKDFLPDTYKKIETAVRRKRIGNAVMNMLGKKSRSDFFEEEGFTIEYVE